LLVLRGEVVAKFEFLTEWLTAIHSAYLGYFDDENEAARKYNKAATRNKKLFNVAEAKSPAVFALKKHRARARSKVIGFVQAFKRSCENIMFIDSGSTSRYKGVSWYSHINKWEAKIMIDGKSSHLGYSVGEEEAAHKYDEAASLLGRSLNFPGEGQVEAVKGSKGDSSRYKGVSWYSQSNKLGYFDDGHDAARKYDDADTAAPLGRPLNFPEDGQVEAVKVSRGGSSRYKGVCWFSQSNKWKVFIRINGKSSHLGYFDCEEEAARKYDEAAATLRPILYSRGHSRVLVCASVLRSLLPDAPPASPLPPPLPPPTA
jgi:hypothetical protein